MFTIITKLTLVLIFFISVGGCSDQKDYSDLIKKSINTSLSENKTVETEIILSNNLSIPVSFDATPKGNGTINIQGLLIRVFDQHDDGVVFKDDFLQLKTQDLNNDGISELIFTGTLVHTGEQETDPVTLEPAKIVYSLDCSTGVFKAFDSEPNIFIEIINKQSSIIKCG